VRHWLLKKTIMHGFNKRLKIELIPQTFHLPTQNAQSPAAGQASRQLQSGVTQPVFVQSATGEFMQDSWMSAAVASSFARIR